MRRAGRPLCLLKPQLNLSDSHQTPRGERLRGEKKLEPRLNTDTAPHNSPGRQSCHHSVYSSPPKRQASYKNSLVVPWIMRRSKRVHRGERQEWGNLNLMEYDKEKVSLPKQVKMTIGRLVLMALSQFLLGRRQRRLRCILDPPFLQSSPSFQVGRDVFFPPSVWPIFTTSICPLCSLRLLLYFNTPPHPPGFNLGSPPTS